MGSDFVKKNGPESGVVSIVTPVFNPDRAALRSCIESVRRQSYPDWEWCIVDDQSTEPWVWSFLRRLARRDRRIRVVRRERNGGISAATNDAIASATGEFIAFLDQDDLLHRDALKEVVTCLRKDRSIDILYTDEDKVDGMGRHYDTFNKPDWSPERLLSQNYCSHLTVVRRELVERVGGLRAECDGSQDHDLWLRVVEHTTTVHHVRKVLYHWRALPTSTAASSAAKPYAESARTKAVSDACARRGISADVIPTDTGHVIVRRRPSHTPLVSIIVPTCGSHKSIWGFDVPMVENFLASSLSRSTYGEVEYVVVYDTVTDDSLLDRLVKMSPTVRLVEFTRDFNFSAKCNMGAVHSRGDRLLFVNDDVEVITPEWIERLIVHLEDETVGAVGPLLLYDNGLVQSAGHRNLETGPNNMGRGINPGAPYGVGSPLQIAREVSGVTGACLAIRRQTFLEMGGFNEEFHSGYNDVDLCLHLLRDGYRNIWTPDARLFHFESQTRDSTPTADEVNLLFRYWGPLFRSVNRDPYVGSHPYLGKKVPV